MEYFRPKINKAYMNEALKKLTEKEKKIFLEMSDYDKFHSLEVYKKIKKTELKNNEKYLKLALLHDCGKENVSIITRVLHKLEVIRRRWIFFINAMMRVKKLMKNF